MVYVEETQCCALAHLQAKDGEPLEEIKEQMADLKEDREGARAVFCIVKDTESNLRANILKLGFRRLVQFPRRRALGPGTLTMYFKKV